MKNQFVAINGKLQSITKKEAKEIIIDLGGNFQANINSKTTIVVNGKNPIKKKKQIVKDLIKKGQDIKVITEEEFIELINESDQPGFVKTRLVFSIILGLIGIIGMTTLFGKLFIILSAITIAPKIADNYLNNIVFKIVVPVSLVMVAITLNIESTIYKINGSWQTSTMALEIGDKESTIDVIDSEGRHTLKGKNKIKDGKFIITTNYKTYEYEYDAKNDTLCYLYKNGNCRFYLKRYK
jgi:hypothetical protein